MTTSFSGQQLLGPVLAVAAMLATGLMSLPPALAADDFPVVGDIHIPMPRILDDEAGPLPEGRYMDRLYDERLYPPRPYADSYRPGPSGSGSQAVIPSARHQRSAPAARPMLPPEQVVTVLRSSGYSPLGRVTQRGWIYSIAALDRNGEDGRLIIDARTGQIIRFIPAQAADDEIAVYGPPPPPPALYAGYENRRGSLLDLRNAPRPPASVPKTARRSAPKAADQIAQPSGSTTTPPAAAPAQQAIATSAQPSPAKPVAETRPAGATVGAAGPSTSALSTVKLWPTQAMPDVQALE